MQALDLNLARRPFRNNTLLWVFYVTSTMLLTAFTIWNVFTYRDHEARLVDLRGRVSTIESRNRDLQVRDREALAGIRGYDIELLRLQAAKANEVIAWKAFSWTRLFNLMEQVQPYDVRMTSIRPLFRVSGFDPEEEDVDRVRRIPVAVEGVAKTFAAFRELQDALHGDPHFGRVEPRNLKRPEQGEILFGLEFLYYPEEPAGADSAEETRSGEETPSEPPLVAEAEAPAADATDAVEPAP